MDAESLRTFLTIHQTGGFSSGAARLNRSQPAISRRIALLEEELGVPLFERVAGGVVLSQAGGLLLPYAQRALAALEDCKAAIGGLRSGAAGQVSIAVVGTLAGANLTPVLKGFSSAHPEVELCLRTATSAEVSDLVRSAQVGIGLRYHRDTSSDLDCLDIARETMRIVCAPDHPQAGARLTSLHVLAKERWLAFPNSRRLPETSGNNLFAQFEVLGVADIAWTPVDSLTAQKRLVEAGYGLAVLPESAIVEELAAKSLATIEVNNLQLANPVCLLTRRNGYLSPATEALIKLLQAS